MKNTIVLNRIKAFLTDYFFIVVYILLLSGFTLLICNFLHIKLNNFNPVFGEVIGFVTLTLPVILYFTVSENGNYAGTIGKRKFGLKVLNSKETKASAGQLIIRNCIKFFPWELAHFFIYRLLYYSSKGIEAPIFILTGLVIAQGLAFIYVLFIFFNKNNQTIYELISFTRVFNNNKL